MADIELVIKMQEELYEAYKGRPPMLGDAGIDMIAQSIANGKPLPKGHGRLIDESDLIPDSDYEDGMFYAVSVGAINGAPTIIEADKGESEDTE